MTMSNEEVKNIDLLGKKMATSRVNTGEKTKSQKKMEKLYKGFFPTRLSFSLMDSLICDEIKLFFS